MFYVIKFPVSLSRPKMKYKFHFYRAQLGTHWFYFYQSNHYLPYFRISFIFWTLDHWFFNVYNVYLCFKTNGTTRTYTSWKLINKDIMERVWQFHLCDIPKLWFFFFLYVIATLLHYSLINKIVFNHFLPKWFFNFGQIV